MPSNVIVVKFQTLRLLEVTLDCSFTDVDSVPGHRSDKKGRDVLPSGDQLNTQHKYDRIINLDEVTHKVAYARCCMCTMVVQRTTPQNVQVMSECTW